MCGRKCVVLFFSFLLTVHAGLNEPLPLLEFDVAESGDVDRMDTGFSDSCETDCKAFNLESAIIPENVAIYNRPYLLSEDETNHWRKNSFIKMENIFSDHIDDLTSFVDEISEWKTDNGGDWMKFYEYEEPTKLSRVENFLPYHQQFSYFISSPSILSIVEQLLGQSGLVYKDRINFKYPGSGPHEAHQDGVAFEYNGKTKFEDSSIPYISMLLAIDPAIVENGALEVPLNWDLDNLDILPMECPYPDRPNYSKIKKDVEESLVWVPQEMNPGDIFFFTERLPHRSKPNNSNLSRRLVYIVFSPVSDGDKRTSYFDAKRNDPNNPRFLIGNPHAHVQNL